MCVGVSVWLGWSCIRIAGFYVLNMFQTLIYPSSEACDYSVKLLRWSYYSWFVVCWSFGEVGLEWYPYCRLLCAQHVSDINISIIISLRLFCWITTLVVLFLFRCVLEFRCGWVGVVSVLQAEAQLCFSVMQSMQNVSHTEFIPVPTSWICWMTLRDWLHVIRLFALKSKLCVGYDVKCSDVKWRDVIYIKWFYFGFQWSSVKWVTVNFLWTKVPCTLVWPYAEGTWLYCDYFIWYLSCTVVVV